MISYDKLCSFPNLYFAYRKARKGKSKKWYVKEFEHALEKNLVKLEVELRTMKYKPSTMKTFVIRDPKTRVISASAFRDRIVHHAICNIIEPIFEKSFIYDSYANRKRKGTHSAIKRFDVFKRKVSRNGTLVTNAKDDNMTIGYVLKADIRHYFDSVDHEILIRILKRKVKDERIIFLIRKIIENHPHEKGMPIGNLTSQLFANVYLHELDHFVKHELKAKYYIRYVDDFVILHKDKRQLAEWKNEIEKFLTTIKLNLHPQKTKIYPIHKGTSLLGFRIFYYYKLPKKSNIKLMKNRVKNYINLYDYGILKKEDILLRIEGWNAYAFHGNTFKLRKRTMKNLIKCMKRIRLPTLTNAVI